MDKNNVKYFTDKIVIGKGPPPKSLEPSQLGILYIDYDKPTLYVCTNPNKNETKWCHIDEQEYIRLNNRIDQLNKLVDSYVKKLDDYMNGRWP